MVGINSSETLARDNGQWNGDEKPKWQWKHRKGNGQTIWINNRSLSQHWTKSKRPVSVIKLIIHFSSHTHTHQHWNKNIVQTNALVLYRKNRSRNSKITIKSFALLLSLSLTPRIWSVNRIRNDLLRQTRACSSCQWPKYHRDHWMEISAGENSN